MNHINKSIGFVVILSVVLAPWMVGATTSWGIRVLNIFGLSLGFLIIAKRIAAWRAQENSNCTGQTFISGKCIWLAFVGIALILGYVLCSALNPRAVLDYSYFPGSSQATGVEIRYLDPIQWLPQSYDANRTFRDFWKYLSVACTFVAIRDWLLVRSNQSLSGKLSHELFPSKKVEVLLWSVSISGSSLFPVGWGGLTGGG